MNTIYSEIEYMMFTMIAALYDKQQLISEYSDYIKFIISTVEAGINLFHLNSPNRLEIIKSSSIKPNNLIRELIEPDSKYLRHISENEIELLIQNGFEYCTYEFLNYPSKFKSIDSPPLFLHWKGNFSKAVGDKKHVAIIGSRITDPKYARAIALQAGQLMAENMVWNHSGLALGCDTAGHCGGIAAYKHGYAECAFTGGILGNGLLSSVYPQENSSLAEEIIRCGGYLLSEMPPSMIVKRTWLILRDRI
ncbi:MAG: DNA-processing protein DprA, partial [Candidatus Cloacimonetes bacterium]|nr:DNA-processing protein DprA [Candidatus Cloacimonadota bacterium]